MIASKRLHPRSFESHRSLPFYEVSKDIKKKKRKGNKCKYNEKKRKKK